MEKINNVFASLDPVITLWVAIGVAVIFILLIIFDAVQSRKKRPRNERARRMANPPPGRLAQLREAVRLMKEEAKQRQRRSSQFRKTNRK